MSDPLWVDGVNIDAAEKHINQAAEVWSSMEADLVFSEARQLIAIIRRLVAEGLV